MSIFSLAGKNALSCARAKEEIAVTENIFGHLICCLSKTQSFIFALTPFPNPQRNFVGSHGTPNARTPNHITMETGLW